MIKKEPAVILFLLITVSCATDPSEESIPKMVPDRTPYIAGLIEASDDTLHHYPEIIVGYFTDVFETDESFTSTSILNSYPGIYNPTLIRQVVQTSILFGLSWESEVKAKVSVRGPLGLPEERKVTFTHEGNGIYGDQDFALARIPGNRYQLMVTLPDERTYKSIMIIPQRVSFSIADSISVDVEYKPFGDGTPKEEDTAPYPIIFDHSKDSYLTVLQYNSDKDRDLLLLEPDEGFDYTNRSNFLRTGIGYAVGFSIQQQDTLYRSWIQRLDKPKEDIWMNKHWWLRFSYFSDGIGKMFFPLLDFFAAGDEWLDQMYEPASDATANNDSTYLFDVSTIRKVGKEGNVLPKDSSDAIGFFGGYYSIYRQTTLYPIRNFDLDSVLTANSKE